MMAAENGLPDGWRELPLKRLMTPRKESVQPEDVPEARYVGLEHLTPGKPDLTEWGDIGTVRSTKSRFSKGDVLYGKLRPYLDKAALAHFDGVCSTDILVFEPTEETTSRYLSYLLHSGRVLQHAIDTMRGTNHPRTKWSSLAGLVLQVPPLTEQEDICELLECVWDTIEFRRRELEFEKENKYALTDQLIHQGTRGSELRKEELGQIPSNWVVDSLSSVAVVQTGVTKGRKLSPEEGVEVPYLRVANVQDGYLDLAEVKTITIRESELDRFALLPGDVLMTEGGDIDKLGRGFIWRGQIDPCVHQNHVFAVRPHPEVVNPEYLAYFVQSSWAKGYFLSVGHRTTNLASINSTKLKALPTVVPPLDEQREIVEILSLCDRKIDALTSEIDLHEELFQALLEELTTGQRSTQLLQADYEVAV